MTIFGADLSSNNAGLTIAELKAAGFSFVSARTISFPNGNMVIDPNYAAWRDEAKALGFPFAGYVLWHTYYTPYQQVHELAQVIGDASIPVLMDMEPDSSNPTIEFEAECWDACKTAGLNPQVLYDPRWYWIDQGDPGLNLRPWRLVSSAYGSNHAGSPSAVYAANGGDSGPGWAGYGGLTPAVWQFGSQLQCAGHLIDGDAFKGTVAQLIATGMFTDWGDPLTSPSSWTTADDAHVEKLFTTVLNQATGQGQTSFAGTIPAILRTVQTLVNILDGQGGDLAALLTHLTNLETAVGKLTAGQIDPAAFVAELEAANFPSDVATDIAAHLTLAAK